MNTRAVLGVGVALLAITFATAAHADELVVENPPRSPSGGVCYPTPWPGFQRGQSFVAAQSGTLTEAGFFTYGNARSTTLSVYALGEDPSAPLATQPISFPESRSPTGTASPVLTTVSLDDPVAVQAGVTYVVEIADASCDFAATADRHGFWMAVGGPFAGGEVVNVRVPNPDTDLAFRFVVEPSPDTTPPTILGSASPAANANGWNDEDVTVSFTCDDESGIESCSSPVVLGEGQAQSVTGHARDSAGNTASATVGPVNVDRTAPVVALGGGPADGAEYVYGSVPPAPGCSAADGLSGLAGPCAVTGWSTAVGTHAVTAAATDLAGNVGSDTRTYTVAGWTLAGFRAPVDMGAVNVVKAGATVPLKFSVHAGDAELTDPSVVASFAQRRISCDGIGSDESPVEVTSTGGTTLRYDQAAGQFVQNWKTPSDRGGCHEVTMTTQDGTSVRAIFRLR